MSPLTSRFQLKFLLDENVKRRLERFLSSKGFNVMRSPEGISNGELASLSKSEKRVLVTSDSDFTDSVLFPKEKIFSVVWLRIPQNEPQSLLQAFSMLLKEKEVPEDFEGKLIILKKEGFEAYPMLSTAP